MKNVLTFLFVTLFIGSSFSQSFIDRYFQDLIDDDNSTVISVSGDMFRFAAVLVDESHNDEINTKDVLNGIKSLQFVAIEESVDPEVEYQKGIRTIPEKMSEMVSVKSKEGRLKVYIDEEDDTVYEIIGIGIDDHSFFVGSVLCEIRLEDRNEVLKQIQAQDNKAFKQLWEVEFDELSVYPNPVSEEQLSIYLGATDEFEHVMTKLYSLDGAQVMNENLRVTNGFVNLNMSHLPQGIYILSLVHNEAIITTRKIIKR